ncbi:MAG: transglycosylase domain-containing protein [Bacteroidales bacterium]|nr:transglycosylase domain-containing protein [Bacteroidales bacterium]MCM1147494.1 transglycosylase domain-containing protein [Bacteroidales bacterium]MCM1206163.1 transglycosylase domain-containing protein [Bacillota bacterium]MCM1510005.1 transglycosylase domain-containing protein [Clostridium sp.]
MNEIKRCIGKINKWAKQFWVWYKKLYKGKPWYTKTCVGIVSMLCLLIVYLAAVDLNLFWLFGKSPGFFDIMNPKTNEASVIYSADGVQIGKYFNENRTPVEYKDVTPQFWRALIDTEDERFYKHAGIDPIGLFGAAKDAVTGRGGRGASTITQQLAKNLFRMRTNYSTGLLGHIPGVKMLIMKSKEWILAVKLEICYSKEEIITMYANTVDFGSNSFGIKTASKTYFNTTPEKLKTEEAAVLVGMLKATTYYNPLVNPENSRNRRNQVLENMVAHNDLSRSECDILKTKDIELNYNVESNYDGQAQYFRNAVADYLKDWCAEEGYDLYSDGLKIYTTIDTRMQKYAEQAAMKQMKQVQQNFNNHWGLRRTQDNFMPGEKPWQDEKHKEIEGFIEGIAQKQPYYKALVAKFGENSDSVSYYLNKPHKVKVFDYEKGEVEKTMSTMDSIRYMVSYMHCAFIAMEPNTGHVKAWVGDIDFDHWKYDKVTAMRQPGSTFKLFVYTEAMNQGLTPCDKRRDEYFSMQVYDEHQKKEVTWAPTNANGYFTNDSMALKSAFARSINSVAVRLGQEVGIKNIARTAHDMGIKSPLDETPSLPLGSSDVNLLELADAYCTVANNGMQREPVLVTRILDHNGNEIYVGPTEETQVIPYKSAFLMQQLLQGGMREPGGTSQALWGYVGEFRDTEFGGKTGTSNNHSDAWFMGISPKLVVGAWVGGEYRCIHFRTGALGQGSRTALPICGYFLQSVLKDPSFKQYHAKFELPNDPDIERGMYICDSYYERKKDTLDIDSLNFEDYMVEIDDNGNPVNQSVPVSAEPVQNKEQQIMLEDL